ncbi:hypothetical protein FQR65_LT02331 [Abscondita terminalis]|nr:hypothetical protein FQR65_LT02331 [Abscondita terminalis]
MKCRFSALRDNDSEVEDNSSDEEDSDEDYEEESDHQIDNNNKDINDGRAYVSFSEAIAEENDLCESKNNNFTAEEGLLNERIGRTIVESVLSYGSKLWVIKEEDKRKIAALKMDYLQRRARVFKLQHITNQKIRDGAEATETVIQRIDKEKGLKWFGHILSMDDTRWPKRLFTWIPP